MSEAETETETPPFYRGKYRDMDGMNEDRAEWANEAVLHFQSITGKEELETGVADLLCNLQHLCYREDFDFHRLIKNAVGMWEQETNLSVTFEIVSES